MYYLIINVGFIILNLILVLIIIFLLVILSWVWPPDSPWSPWWKTDKNVARKICELANIKSSDIVYELGSGNGTFLITAAKEFRAKGVGIEIDPLRFLTSTIVIHIIGMKNKVVIKRRNFFDEDLSRATIIYVYLVPKALNLLLPKFKKELKKGTKIISYKYEINLPVVKKDLKNKLFLYEI